MTIMADFQLTEEQENTLAEDLAAKHTEAELAAMATEIEKDDAMSTPEGDKKVEPTPDVKPDPNAQALENERTELKAQWAELSKTKIRNFADKLVSSAQLHATHLEAFVARTTSLELDDRTKDKDGKSELDRYLDEEVKTRGKSVEFSRTARSPKSDNSVEAKLEAMGDETDMQLARMEADKLALDGVGFSRESEEFDALATKIQTKLKCDYGKAMDLAWQITNKKEGE